MPLELIEHPEGGRFCEVFRSSVRVHTPGSAQRCALTHIYFALEAHEHSAFHRVSSDEVWNLYRGVLRLHRWDGAQQEPQTITLDPAQECFCAVVPGGWWQAAEPLDGPVLVGCSVAPGFEFADFELLRRDQPTAQDLLARRSQLAHLLIDA
ncbi:MAG: cupin domain-containing protein [Planctomycetota bacterium]